MESKAVKLHIIAHVAKIPVIAVHTVLAVTTASDQKLATETS